MPWRLRGSASEALARVADYSALPPTVGFLHCDWLMKQRQRGLAAIPAGSSSALSDEALAAY